MTKTYAVALPLLSLWLIAWIAFSWGAVQDDAFIHLRYAENLALHHFITYDGVHPNYGASSLLYVSLLAALRGFTSSPDLPRAFSSAMHLLIFAGLAISFAGSLPAGARLARGAALLLLTLLCVPSAVRWLDDGMETSAGAALVCLLVWLIHRQMREGRVSRRSYAVLAGLSCLAVLLRIELLLLCIMGTAALTLGRLAQDRHAAACSGSGLKRWGPAFAERSPLFLGAGAAVLAIYSTMHVVLPDTALAKSHGIGAWFRPLHDTAITLGGAFSFGMGMLFFWLLTLLLTLLHEKAWPSTSTILINSLFPVLLTVSSLRGQEIQGARYFVWAFLASSLWNILELARNGEPTETSDAVRMSGRRVGFALLYGFAGLLLLELPIETTAMRRVFLHRRETLVAFETQHLDVLKGRRGIASDIGYIGYFTKANLCDLAGLVNGRAAVRLSSHQRMQACAATNPDFLFASTGELSPMTAVMDLSDWQICGRYDLTNVTSLDSHYLVVRPSLADEVCAATGAVPRPLRENEELREAMHPVLARNTGL